MSDPRPILHRGGLINSPDASLNTLAACGRMRSAGDFPLAGLVGEAVSDLEVHREDVVGQKLFHPNPRSQVGCQRAMSANASKSLADARSPCQGGNRTP